jgi:hypothetical protein
MSARRQALVRRLVGGAVDAVGDRAPWLSDQAYRLVASPLQWADPSAGARAADARLDDIRDRVVDLAAKGRVKRAEQRRIQRDLSRTREDLQRLTPRLPAVQARGLALRLTAYAEVLATLPGRPVDRGRSAHLRDGVVLTGASGAWTGALLPVAGAPGAVGAGIAAGVATTLTAAAARERRARRERLGAVADALAEVDRAVHGRDGVDVRDLDRDRRDLVVRAWNSRRLDKRTAGTLRRIDAHLDDLLIRLVEDDLEPDATHLVRATVTRYLPDTLEPFLALSDPSAVVRGRPATAEVADQLASIEKGLADVARRPHRKRPETLLLLQGEFLRSKFGESSI